MGAPRDHALERAAKIFGLVKHAAERGEPCPTNTALRERFACGQSCISSAFNLLEAAGMIRVERGNVRRVVTICATGQRTAGDAGNPHWTTTRRAARASALATAPYLERTA